MHMPPGNQPHNQYDFIMGNRQKSKRPSLSLPAPDSQKQRIIVLAGIVAILLIFFLFIIAIVRGGGENKDTFLKVLQQQTEIARVAGIGAAEASASQNTKNAATNTQLSVSSGKQSLVKTLGTVGVKFGDKQLAGVPNQKTDERLTEAKAAANFDSTLIALLSEQVTDYQASLQQAYDTTGSKSLKGALATEYQNAQTLRKLLDTTRP